MASGDNRSRSGANNRGSADRQQGGKSGSKPDNRQRPGSGSSKSAGGSKSAGKSKTGVKAAKAMSSAKKPVPWGVLAAVLVLVLLAGGIFAYTYTRIDAQNAAEERASAAQDARDKRLAPRNAVMKEWAPTQQNPDPSRKIKGVTIKQYEQGQHVQPTQRVAYDQSPPFGGPHDAIWADCTGVDYKRPVRSENMVHALEHGTVWIAYNPDKVRGKQLSALQDRAINQPFTMLSPYPGLDRPISLQSWGHQLKVDDAEDERIDQFIGALRRNQNTYPEVGATCEALGPGQFETNNPPPFVADPGPGAVPMSGGQQAQNENMGGQPGAGAPVQP